jgi:hypothetical protein
MPCPHVQPCDEIIILKEKVAALEAWRARTESDLKEIREIISQVKLLMSLSIGVIDRANMYQAQPPECVPGMIARIHTTHSRPNVYQA